MIAVVLHRAENRISEIVIIVAERVFFERAVARAARRDKQQTAQERQRYKTRGKPSHKPEHAARRGVLAVTRVGFVRRHERVFALFVLAFGIGAVIHDIKHEHQKQINNIAQNRKSDLIRRVYDCGDIRAVVAQYNVYLRTEAAQNPGDIF